MKVTILIEKLDDLATFLTLSASDAGKEQYKERRIEPSGRTAAFHEGQANAFNTAFKKVDKIIKEAKQ